MTPRMMIFLAAVLGALAVASGAFAAHVLRDLFTGNTRVGRLDAWETAAKYHMYHALALLAVGVLASINPSYPLQIAAWCFVSGVVIFSGMLYLLSLTQISILGAIVPIGGILLIAGWVALAVHAWRYLPLATN